jgi:myo-inositol-1(or 4)-monophosphatase
VTGFQGQPTEITDRDVLATNGRVHDEIVHEFSEIFAGRGIQPLPDPREYGKT